MPQTPRYKNLDSARFFHLQAFSRAPHLKTTQPVEHGSWTTQSTAALRPILYPAVRPPGDFLHALIKGRCVQALSKQTALSEKVVRKIDIRMNHSTAPLPSEHSPDYQP